MSDETRIGGGERAGAGRSPAGEAQDAGEEARIEALEREAEALRAVNAKLMRERLGQSNTAAAGALVATGEPARPLPRLAAKALSPFRRLRLALRRVLLRALR